MSGETLPELTEEQLAALEFRYAVQPACRVCGTPLELMDTRGMKMACPSDGASSFTARHTRAGVTWLQAIEHYDASVRYGPPPGDSLVVQLVREVRRLRQAVTPAEAGQG